MSYERQLKCEQQKEKMYNLTLEKPHTRRMLMQALGMTKGQINCQLQRLVMRGHIKLHPFKTSERSHMVAVQVSQYVAVAKLPYKAKVKEVLKTETVARFATAVATKRKREDDPPGVYRLLDYPLAAPKRTHKKTVVSIASGFNQLGW